MLVVFKITFKQRIKTIDHFKVTSAILPGEGNAKLLDWGERKMYSECMEKVGRLMLDNLRKVDIVQFL